MPGLKRRSDGSGVMPVRPWKLRGEPSKSPLRISLFNEGTNIMIRIGLLRLCIVGGIVGFCVHQSAAAPVVIFKDDFQTDTAGTGNVTGDLDPAIDTGAGDIGSW